MCGALLPFIQVAACPCLSLIWPLRIQWNVIRNTNVKGICNCRLHNARKNSHLNMYKHVHKKSEKYRLFNNHAVVHIGVHNYCYINLTVCKYSMNHELISGERCGSQFTRVVFKLDFTNWYLGHFPWNRWVVQTIAWCRQATKLLPKPMLTQIYVAIWRHYARMSE